MLLLALTRAITRSNTRKEVNNVSKDVRSQVLIGKKKINERYNSSRWKWYKVVSNYKSHFQAINADLRQTDDLLSFVNSHDVGHKGNIDHHNARRPFIIQKITR